LVLIDDVPEFQVGLGGTDGKIASKIYIRYRALNSNHDISTVVTSMSFWNHNIVLQSFLTLRVYAVESALPNSSKLHTVQDYLVPSTGIYIYMPNHPIVVGMASSLKDA
jgi:hypothetical protein